MLSLPIIELISWFHQIPSWVFWTPLIAYCLAQVHLKGKWAEFFIYLALCFSFVEIYATVYLLLGFPARPLTIWEILFLLVTPFFVIERGKRFLISMQKKANPEEER